MIISSFLKHNKNKKNLEKVIIKKQSLEKNPRNAIQNNLE